ncbi:alpha-hydroxy acid oxidase [Sphingomonas oligophenolica]|uniref:Alpha-hydroxy acid oxidase n=1 Tax=Sphingomonas oligophenolica TaxID=301154 RepID=A0ABU9Y986_9SPHN
MSSKRAVTISDLQRAARRYVPDFAFKPAEIGTGDGRGPVSNVAAFAGYVLVPRVPESPVVPALATTLFGRSYALPFGISAIGYAGKMRADTDFALAQAAVAANIPFLLSGGSVASLEAVAKIAPDHVWQQLYAAADPAITDDFLARGLACGRDVLVLTVDMPTPPIPDWLLRSGILPPGSVARRAWPHFLWQLATHPRWTVGHVCRGGMPRMEGWAKYLPDGASPAAVAAFAHGQIVSGVSWPEVDRIRQRWPGKFVVKGLLHPDDVARAFALGADAVTVSNHGGNKMENAISSLAALETIRQAGTGPVFFDGGIRCGADLVTARALGSDFSFIGRAALYGALADGRAGALRAIAILQEQLERSLMHLGIASLEAATPGLVRRVPDR